MDRGLWAIVGVYAFVILALVSCVFAIEKQSCVSKYADFQPEYHGVITGCLVQHNGKTVPAESLRAMN